MRGTVVCGKKERILALSDLLIQVIEKSLEVAVEPQIRILDLDRIDPELMSDIVG